MGNTPNLALPYPELTDTAHVPRDIKALADKIDVLLGGSGSGGGGGSSVGANLPVLDVGVAGQVRAGRQLTVADFTSIGLTQPVGLFNLSGLTNLGTDARPLVNLGAVPFGVGINGLASTAAVFAGSTGQALYIADSGASDPFRIRTGSWGCWFRTAKRGAYQSLAAKAGPTAQYAWGAFVDAANLLTVWVSADGTTTVTSVGVSDVADDRWHHLVGTYDGTTIRAYVDGALESTRPLAGVIQTATGPLNIGAQGADSGTAGASPNYGRVDEAFVTPDILSPDQIRVLYAARLTHTLGAPPSAVRLNVHRRKKGAALAVTDFVTQPVRLHNFTAGALTDQGSGNVPVTAQGTAPVAVAGADGAPAGAYSFGGAGSLASTDAGLPGGLTARSYGCWFKTTSLAVQVVVIWGTGPAAHDNLFVQSGSVFAGNGSDNGSAGPYVSDGQWHHAVVTEDNAAGDGVKRKFYVDGRLVSGSTVMNSLTLAGANAFRIGAGAAGASPFTGQIDGAFVTGYPLTPAEIAGLYSKGSQDMGASPKNPGDHVERTDATSVLFIGDTLESQYNVDVAVIG